MHKISAALRRKFGPPLNLELWQIARLLCWDQYAPLIDGTPPRYSRVWRLEGCILRTGNFSMRTAITSKILN